MKKFFLFCLVIPQLIAAQEQSEIYSYSLHFDKGSSEVTAAGNDLQDSILQLLGDDIENYSVTIDGHTDATGSRAINEKLVKKRTESVRNDFVSSGFKNSQITMSWKVGELSGMPSTIDNANDRRADILIKRLNPASTAGTQAPGLVSDIDMEAVTGIMLPREIRKINPCVENQLVFNSGTRLLIPANSFPDAGCDELNVVLREMRSPIDFILAGIPMSVPTEDGVEHFNSAGMFEFKALRDGKEFPVSTDAEIQFSFKASADPDSFDMFGFDNRTNAWSAFAAPPMRTDTVTFTNVHYENVNQKINNPFCRQSKIELTLTDFEIQQLLENASSHLRTTSGTVTLSPSPESSCQGLYRPVQFRFGAQKIKGEPTRFHLSAVNEKFNAQTELASLPLIVNGLRTKRNFNELYVENLKFSGGKIKKKGKLYLPDNFRVSHGRTTQRLHQPLLDARYLSKSYKRITLYYHLPETTTKDELATANAQLKEVQLFNKNYYKQGLDSVCINPAGNTTMYLALNMVASKLTPTVKYGTREDFYDFMQRVSSQRDSFLTLFDSVKGSQSKSDSLLSALGRKKVILSSTQFNFATDSIITGVLGGISTFNADQLIKMKNLEKLVATYVDENGKEIKMKIAYYLTSRLNGVIVYNGYIGTPDKFPYLTGRSNRLLLLDKNNIVYTVDKSTFAEAVAKNANNAVFAVKKMEKGSDRTALESELAAK